jgi:hypothetical protein
LLMPLPSCLSPHLLARFYSKSLKSLEVALESTSPENLYNRLQLVDNPEHAHCNA